MVRSDFSFGIYCLPLFCLITQKAHDQKIKVLSDMHKIGSCSFQDTIQLNFSGKLLGTGKGYQIKGVLFYFLLTAYYFTIKCQIKIFKPG